MPLAGIPVKSGPDYLRRLVQHGFRVAICEQVEDPKLAKGIVRREVVETISPGKAVLHMEFTPRGNEVWVSTLDGSRPPKVCTSLWSATTGGAGGVSLKGVCPDTVSIQTDWNPEGEHGFLYQMIGPGYTVEKVGRTSMRIRIEVMATRDRGETEVKVTEGLFTFVAIDEQARPRPIDQPA